MVITGRTRNAFDLRVTWVRIPPSPFFGNRFRIGCHFLYRDLINQRIYGGQYDIFFSLSCIRNTF